MAEAEEDDPVGVADEDDPVLDEDVAEEVAGVAVAASGFSSMTIEDGEVMAEELVTAVAASSG